MPEIWKDIKGYEGRYQISNVGRVKSLPKKLPNGRNKKRKDIETTYSKWIRLCALM